MRGFFDFDGPFMDAMRKLSDIVIYNLLFCLASLPVITVGAAMTALHEGMQRVAEGEDADAGIWKDFWSSFRRNFLPGTKLWLVTVACGFYLYALQNAVLKLSGSEDGSGLGGAYAITYYVCAFIFIFVYQNFFPVRARWSELSLLGCIARAFWISIISFPRTMLAIFLTYAFAFVTLILNGNVFKFGIFIWASCGFGIVAYFTSLCFLPGVKKLEEQLKRQADGTADNINVGGSIFVDTINKVGEAQKEAFDKKKSANMSDED